MVASNAYLPHSYGQSHENGCDQRPYCEGCLWAEEVEVAELLPEEEVVAEILSLCHRRVRIFSSSSVPLDREAPADHLVLFFDVYRRVRSDLCPYPCHHDLCHGLSAHCDVLRLYHYDDDPSPYLCLCGSSHEICRGRDMTFR